MTILAILFWTSIVRTNRVLQHGQTYAIRLLETLDWMSAPPETSPS